MATEDAALRAERHPGWVIEASFEHVEGVRQSKPVWVADEALRTSPKLLEHVADELQAMWRESHAGETAADSQLWLSMWQAPRRYASYEPRTWPHLTALVEPGDALLDPHAFRNALPRLWPAIRDYDGPSEAEVRKASFAETEV